MNRLLPLILILALATGCSFVPEIAYQPVIHNPFPQLSKVAVAPFFNLSTDATVDGRAFALAYFAELQQVPGFEVVPVGVVENTMHNLGIQLSGAEEARRLANALGVDAVVIGAITDFDAYYPPRCGFQVEWYAANPCFHPIPAGYGLPWGTPEEEHIPARLIFEAEMALAKEQLKTQTHPVDPAAFTAPPLPTDVDVPPPDDQLGTEISYSEAGTSDVTDVTGTIDATGPVPGQLPPDWPDPHGFTPPGPLCELPHCQPTNEPVLRHTALYSGHDSDFTEALSSYVFFRDDARFGGWQSYLQRSDDFIRFCCHTHIAEMLSARGGAGETRVVWRWSADR